MAKRLQQKSPKVIKCRQTVMKKNYIKTVKSIHIDW